MKILLFMDSHFIPNLHKIIYSMEHKRRYFVKMGISVLFVHTNISFRALMTFITWTKKVENLFFAFAFYRKKNNSKVWKDHLVIFYVLSF